MSTTEALRLQLQTAQTELNAAQVENRRLRDANPFGAQLQDMEAELAQTREENVRLVQEVDRLSRTAAGEGEAEETGMKETVVAGLRETIATLKDEAARMRRALEEEEERTLEEAEECRRIQSRADQAAEQAASLSNQLERACQEAELEKLRTVREETRKWEKREARLVRRVEELERSHTLTVGKEKEDFGELRGADGLEHGKPENWVLGEGVRLDHSKLADEHLVDTTDSHPLSPQVVPSQSGGSLGTVNLHGLGVGGAAEPVSTPVATPRDPLSMALLAQQLPPLPTFSGGQLDGDGESIGEWLERIELVAGMCQWDNQAKLVNVVTRLRGEAYRFYRSCTHQQRATYTALTAKLRNRFTPVTIQSVQSSRFHERRQSPSETVDAYAQDLRQLFHQAYSQAQHEGPGAEKMGHSVLTYQFVAGLGDRLKMKLVGSEGSFEELLARARFEEAKGRELPNPRSNPTPKKTFPTNHQDPPAKDQRTGMTSPQATVPRKGRQCFNCGLEGHMARSCPYPKPSRRQHEAKGRHEGEVAAMVGSGINGNRSRSMKEEIEELRCRLRDMEMADAVEDTTATMHGMAVSQPVLSSMLGPTVLVEMEVNGVPVKALVDTGSPATIIALDWVLSVLAKERRPDQTPAEWKKQTLKRFAAPEVHLKSYGGHRLEMTAQIDLTLSRGNAEISATVLVQKNAPNPLLLGTDLQSSLGFALVVERNGSHCDLLSGRMWMDGPCENPKTQPLRNIPVSRAQSESTHCNPTVGVVRLLKATRIPAGYRKVVRANVVGMGGDTPLLFTAGKLEDTLRMDDGVVEVGEGSCVTLLVENQGRETLRLKEGTELGVVSPAEVLEGGFSGREWESGFAEAMLNTRCVRQLTTAEEPGDGRHEQLLRQLKLPKESLTAVEREQLETLLSSYSDIFALDPSELGTTGVTTHTIDTGDHPPIKQQLRRMPFALRAKVEELIHDMLDQGVIVPSKSPWASPVVLVRKKSGEMRFCVDYRKLNQVTKLDEFPLPRIDDTLDLLGGARYFTALDLASGYWQVEMEAASQEKTAFSTYAGLFEFRKMPFGLANAPATFQRLMEVVLAGLARKICLVYLDDVLVLGRTLDEHNTNLAQVLKRLREAGLRLKPQKCSFAMREVEYLGHIVSQEGIRTAPSKLEAVKQFPVPKDVKSLRSFVGLVSYYRRFVPGFSRVAAPLHALTRKDVPFRWTEECQQAFEELRRLLTDTPVLAFPNFTRPFILETDASGAGLGAVLAQEQEDGTRRPIAYASRSLQAHERNYGATELEGLGVVWAVKHFRAYLYGHRCKVYTDHEALKALLNTPQPSGKLARWGMAIQELDLQILHRSGKHNENADALSRFPVVSEGTTTATIADQVVAAVTPVDPDTLPSLQRSDPELNQVVTYLESGVLPPADKDAKRLALTESQYVLRDGVLYHVAGDGTLRVVPPEGLREKLFQEAHGGRFGGHLGDAKVYSELQRHYWWRGMRGDISRWVRGCLKCATYGTGRTVRPPLTPIPVAGPFDRVGVDVVQLPLTRRGNRYAVVFVDYLTKWPEVFAVPDQTAATIARLLTKEIISRHGVPAEILSDRGPAFLSGLLKEVELLLGYHKANTTAYHPQTDGLVERYNRTLIAMLAKVAEDGGRDWDEKLPFVLFAYRASQQQSTLESPFFLLYGRDPRLPTETALSPPAERASLGLKEYGLDLMEKLSSAWELAQKCVGKAQQKQKAYYDRTSRLPNFGVGERVFLFCPAAKTGEARKLARPYHGPYCVVELSINTARIRRVDRPQDDTILVALGRLRKCAEEIRDECWPPGKKRSRREKIARQELQTKETPARVTNEVAKPSDARFATIASPVLPTREPRPEGRWAGRLRKRS